MELILVRHGQSKTNVEAKHQTFEDPLTKEGRSMLAALPGDFDSIYSSDMPRALETANIMFPTKQIMSDVRLREKRNGIMEGLKKGDADWSKVNEQPFLERKAEGGESIEDVVARVKEFLESLHEGKHVLVTHGTTMRIIVALILDIDLERLIRTLQIGNGSVLTLSFDKLPWR
jgi:2,3-bisphosphoglycerate-dependent phosphoglycerate mutase